MYFLESNRSYGGGIKIGTVQFLVGLVSEQRIAEEQIKSLSEMRTQRHQLGRQTQGHPLTERIHQVYGDSGELDWATLGGR